MNPYINNCCFSCKKEIKKEEETILIVRCRSTFSNIALGDHDYPNNRLKDRTFQYHPYVIPFHLSCFSDVGGKEYIPTEVQWDDQ